jgi:hypothetical protein
VADRLELLEAVISAMVAAVMLNVFGKVRWQRIVPFVDPQVPGSYIRFFGVLGGLLQYQFFPLTRNSKHVSVGDCGDIAQCTVLAH